MPRVSVILPNYNYARYLKERVRSILNQTMGDFELLYLDDASTDNSNELMRAFADDARVQMHCFEQNSGRVYQRWNDGARLAQGDWLWFAGADDTAHPRFLERLLGQADSYSNAGILYANTSAMDGDGKITLMKYTTPLAQEMLESDGCIAGYTQLSSICQSNWLWTASSLLLRRDAFEEAGGWDARLRQAADVDLYLSLLYKYDAAIVAEPMAAYRMHSGTVTSNTKLTVLWLELAFCRARVYNNMQHDDRFSDQQRADMRCEIKKLLFEVFMDPEASIPVWLHFAVETIYNVVPDKRLISKLE